MRTLIVILFLFMPFISSVEAAPKCKAKKNQTVTYNTRKKACVYKKCAVRSGLTLSVQSNKCADAEKRDYGDWSISRNTDVLTGQLSVVASLVSDEPFFDGVGYSDTRLFMRCATGVLDVYIGTSDFLDNDGVSVAWRWGSSTTIVNQTWTESVDGRAAFYAQEKYVGTLINFLGQGDKFIIRFENYGTPSGTSDAVFSTGAGAKYAAEDVLAACAGVNQFCEFDKQC